MKNTQEINHYMKEAYRFYVLRFRLMNEVNFKLCMVKTLLNGFPMLDMWEAKMFVDHACKVN